mmetsp:Transcript_25739/g.59515  ORF Transcript_25739/g.59515 Transcript_25739/m.59515 type:complete len:214 (+) Transcript_25739:1225-1866(+)
MCEGITAMLRIVTAFPDVVEQNDGMQAEWSLIRNNAVVSELATEDTPQKRILNTTSGQHICGSSLHMSRACPPNRSRQCHECIPNPRRHEVLATNHSKRHDCSKDFTEESTNGSFFGREMHQEILNKGFLAWTELESALSNDNLIVNIGSVLHSRPPHCQCSRLSSCKVHHTFKHCGLADVVHACIKLEALVLEGVCAAPSNIVLFQDDNSPA